jgi:hypothetical protein
MQEGSKISSLLVFDTVSTIFIPGKISSGKKVSKLSSIAELRAFYGSRQFAEKNATLTVYDSLFTFFSLRVV